MIRMTYCVGGRGDKSGYDRGFNPTSLEYYSVSYDRKQHKMRTREK